jgi:primase-polymerase (primpol)-like protein
MANVESLAALERGKGPECIAAMGGNRSYPTAGVPVKERVPDCLGYLADARLWCVWAWKMRPGKDGVSKRTKPPLRAIGGRAGGFAKNDDPKTRATYSEASAAMTSGRLDGIGLQLLGLSGFIAFDLDDVRDRVNGTLLPWAADLVARSGSYVEVTPSGQGLRILGRISSNFPATHTNRSHVE